MTRQRTLIAAPSMILTAIFATGLLAGNVSAGEGDPKPCVSSSFKIAKVEAACKTGGQAAAKRLMKDATKKAKAAGVTEGMKCNDCHANLKTYELKGSDSVAKIKKWL